MPVAHRYYSFYAKKVQPSIGEELVGETLNPFLLERASEAAENRRSGRG
jgi:hypothetical protein